MRLRELLRQHVDRALDRCDALLLPTLPMAAPPLGAATVELGDADEPVRAAMLRLTQLFNVTGHPALAVRRAAVRDGLPRASSSSAADTARLLALGREVERYISGGPGSVGGGTGWMSGPSDTSGSPGGIGVFTGGGCLMTSGG